MKKKIPNIGIAFIIGALCRYLFFRLYGLFWSSTLRHGLKDYFFCLFPKSFGSNVFLIQILIEISIVAFVSIIVPAIIFGYITIESKKQYWIYSISSFIGMISYDLFYYSFIVKDLKMLLDNYLPPWNGMAFIFIWIVLFYWTYSLGRYLRLKK